MINNIGLALYECMTGQQVKTFLSRSTGFSEKTWSTGGPKTSINQKIASDNAHDFSYRHLLSISYSESEAKAILDGAPERKNGIDGVYSGIIDFGSGFKTLYPRTMHLANQLDAACDAWESLPKEDFTEHAKILLSNKHINNESCFDWRSEKSIENAKECIASGTIEIEHINDLCIYISFCEFMSLLACWDVEFLQNYLSTAKTQMASLPLFEYLMPRLLTPVESIIKENGQLAKNWHSLPYPRLLNFISTLLWKKQYGDWPSKIPKRQEQERYFSSEDNPIILPKIRNGRSKLTANQFARLFKNGLWHTGQYSKDEVNYIPPFPLYFAAATWDRFFVTMKNEHVSSLLYDNEGWYRKLWNTFQDKKEMPGPDITIEPWPKYIMQELS